ncbi:MAG: FAD-dependent thymidylate synthase [Monoglobales bacterium]
MNVQLLAYTPDPEKIVASAAKLCYSSAKVSDIMDGLDEEKTEKFLNMLMDLGHESPVEHINFTFGIEGVSRSLLAQFTRHRIASYSVKSQRYVSEKEFSFVVPPAIENNEAAKKIYLETMAKDTEDYNRLTDLLKADHMANGMEEKKAEKAAQEDARYILPNACETNMIVTMNARSLYNFFHHRCCTRAQWEIRECAFLMYKLVKDVAPTIFKKAGPSCVAGPCPEGKMSCGLAAEMRKKYE